MSLLAACISKNTNEPISTGMEDADENIRSPLFREIFYDLLPENLRQNNTVQEVCLNLLLGDGFDELIDNPKRIPAHELLTFSALPVAGVAMTFFTGNAPAPGIWTAAGAAIGLGAFFLPKVMKQK